MKRVAFIGQAMPRHKGHPNDWPSLNNWLYSIGIIDSEIKEYFLYSALVDYFPGSHNGSHRIPIEEEIKKESSRLKKTICDFRPEIVVPVGKLSIAYCLSKEVEKLDQYIGKTFKTDPYELYGKEIPVIPFPHPSGASTWYRRKEHLRLLQEALSLLKRYLS